MRGLLPVLVLACTPPQPTPEAPPVQPTPSFSVPVPTDFIRDPVVSESIAIEQIQLKSAKALCSALLRADATELAPWLAADFEGRGARVSAAVESPPLKVQRFEGEARSVDAAGLVSLAQRLALRQRCKLKPDGFKLAADQRSAWARLQFELAGADAEGRRSRLRGVWSTSWVAGEPWRLRRAEIQDLVQTTAIAPGFTEVSAQLGFRLGRSQASEAALGRLNDARNLEAIGGLAVVDLDGDGREDVAAWNRHRQMVGFINEDGGFRRQADLLPPTEVGFFHLWYDLDHDGQTELLSTEVEGCEGKRARFPIYRWAEGRARRVAALSFGVASCAEVTARHYQHIAVGDLDADGHLDLVFAGYGAQMVRGAFNQFDSSEGLRNPVFLGRGGLNFEEAGERLGLTDTRLTYAHAVFDLDEDGDQDLIATNDFGPNAVYLNEGAQRGASVAGRARFRLLREGQLVEHGQSMGITVTDLDADGRFDIYVSNMSSSAGRRVAPLFSDTLQPKTLAALERLAAGNSVYVKGAKGWARKTLGLERAQWAWGQAAADLDNDGDRDVYVVNGLNSHRRIREHDF